eukprot:6492414-Amphidinium_carterae.2
MQGAAAVERGRKTLYWRQQANGRKVAPEWTKSAEWQIVTCNSTVWNSMVEQLEDWESQQCMPHLLAMQEHHLEDKAIPAASLTAARLGVRMLFESAIPAKVRTHAGAAVGAKAFIGRMRLPPPEEECLRGRVCAGKFNIGIPGGITVISIYLTACADVSTTRNELHALLHYVRLVEGPWIVCGDWNLTPQQLRQWSFAEAAGGEIHHTKHATCKAGIGRVLDYFLVARELSDLIVSVERLEESLVSPHWAVRMTLRRTKPEDHARVRRKKCQFPEVQPIGPLRWQPLPEWRENLVQHNLGSCWREWSLAAEDWLQGALDQPPQSAAWSHRGKGPEFRLVPLATILQRRTHPRITSQALAWRRLLVVLERIQKERTQQDMPSYDWAMRACHAQLQQRLEPLVLAGAWWTVCDLVHQVAFASSDTAARTLELVRIRTGKESQASARSGALSWKAWVQESMIGGASKAHKWLNRMMQEQGQEHSADDPICHGTPDTGAAGLEQVTAFWRSIWQVHPEPKPVTYPPSYVRLPPITVQEICLACATYPCAKARGSDDWSIRTWAWLPEAFLA